MMYFLVLFLLSQTSAPVSAQMTAAEILQKVDDNYIAENRRVITTMIVHGNRSVRTMKALSYIHGIDQAFTEYLYPERDKGTKMLKIKDELWIFSPSTDRIVKIAGHLLRRSMMGSDISYEDYMEDPELTALYEATLDGEEKLGDRMCYILKLTAKRESISYFTRQLWIDKERFLPLREHRFAKSGKVLKELTINEVFQINDRWYPRNMTFKDVLQKGEGTECIIESIEFDVEIPDHIFTKASLR